MTCFSMTEETAGEVGDVSGYGSLNESDGHLWVKGVDLQKGWIWSMFLTE